MDGFLSAGLLGTAEEAVVSESTQCRLIHIVRLGDCGVVRFFADLQLQFCGIGILGVPLPDIIERTAVELNQRVDLFFGERPFADGIVAAVTAVDIVEAAV